MMQEIIGITGWKGHGKDTLAKMICEFSPSWNIVHFADPLKRMSGEIFGLSESQLHDPILKEEEFSTPVRMDDYLDKMSLATSLNLLPLGKVARCPRHVLQFFGTDYVRSVCPSYWLDQFDSDISEMNYIVVPDLRFLNEAELLKSKYYAFFVRVERLGVEKNTEHLSEREISQIEVDLDLLTVTGNFSLQEEVAEHLSFLDYSEASRYDRRVWEFLSHYYGGS